MGQQMAVQCKSCHYDETFTTGVGMSYSSLSVVMEFGIVDDPTLSEIVAKHKTHTEQYWHGVFHCTACNGLYERFFVRVVYDDDKVYETKFTCPSCSGKHLEPVDDDAPEDYPCPKCGELALTLDDSLILWD